MPYYFKKGKNVTETHTQKNHICTVYEEDAATDWAFQKYFGKFQAGDFSQDDAPLSSRPVEVDSNQIETLTENKQHYTMQETANKLKTGKSSTENHLHQPSYVYCFDVWIPHKLSNKNLFNHISACGSPLKHNEKVPLVKQIVTGSEKWIFYK